MLRTHHLSPSIWLECCVLEGSIGELPWATCLEIAGSGGNWFAHPFFLIVWFKRECDEALLSVAIMGHVLRSMVKLEAENGRKDEFLITSNNALSLCGNMELSW
jgi:hypothetical protein